MKIHEYQARQLLADAGVPVPPGAMVQTVDEAATQAHDILKAGNGQVVIKAQVHAGGRGKAGFVKLVRTTDQAREAAKFMLSNRMVSPQTGPEGLQVKRLLVEEGVGIARELYVGLVIDRTTQKVVVMASSEGGTEIEEVAAKTPEKIHKLFIDPTQGLGESDALAIMKKLDLSGAQATQGASFLRALYQAFWDTDASLAEINPLVVTTDDAVIALDAKFNFDDNALFRHPDVVAMRDTDEEDPAELEASAVEIGRAHV